MIARYWSKGTQSSRESVSEKVTPGIVGLKDEFGKRGSKTF